jgi:hypothetical protein
MKPPVHGTGRTGGVVAPRNFFSPVHPSRTGPYKGPTGPVNQAATALEMKRTAVAWEWEGVDVDTTAPKKDNGDKVRCSPSHFVLVFGLELQCLAGGWAVVTTGVTDGWMDGPMVV